jgi:hypothetical protein
MLDSHPHKENDRFAGLFEVNLTWADETFVLLAQSKCVDVLIRIEGLIKQALHYEVTEKPP